MQPCVPTIRPRMPSNGATTWWLWHRSCNRMRRRSTTTGTRRTKAAAVMPRPFVSTTATPIPRPSSASTRYSTPVPVLLTRLAVRRLASPTASIRLASIRRPSMPSSRGSVTTRSRTIPTTSAPSATPITASMTLRRKTARCSLMPTLWPRSWQPPIRRSIPRYVPRSRRPSMPSKPFPHPSATTSSAPRPTRPLPPVPPSRR